MLTRLTALPRDSRDTLFLLVVIAWVLVPQVERIPLWCSLAAGGVLLWRGWLALQVKPLPGRFWLLGALGLTLAATYATHRTLIGPEAGVTLLVVLLTLKTLELRARRDAFVVFFLSFFCMLSNFLHSQSLLTAFGMLAGLLGLLTMLVNAHMPVGRPPLLDAAKTAGWMALLGAPIMLVLFVLFPRMAPLWGVPADDNLTGRSGLSGSMEVGAIAKLALDESMAMRVRFEGPPPPQKDLYFRGPVLSSFDGRNWQPMRARSLLNDSLPANLQVTGTPINYEVTLEPTRRRWLLLLDAAVKPPELPGPPSVMMADLQWIAARPITDMVRYKAQSHLEFRHGPQQQTLGLQDYLDLPPGFNPRTLALAAEIRRDARYANASNTELVGVVMDRLRTGGYTYTLEPGVYGTNTADEFWFDRKTGFCEHIASAFVVLMRALDIPARIVTGYQGGTLNTVGGFWVVRQSDAHAWAEVWQPEQGWVRVDPTSAVAPGRIGSFDRLLVPQGVVGQALNRMSPTLAAQLRATWEAVNNGWNQWVLNYTQGQQLNLLKDIGFDTPSWEDLSYLLLGIIVVVSLVGASWTLWDRTQHDPWLRLLARARKQLAKAGIDSSTSTSPRQLAQQVMARQAETTPNGMNAQALHDWLIALEAERYANAHPQQRTHQHKRLGELKRQFDQLAWPG